MQRRTLTIMLALLAGGSRLVAQTHGSTPATIGGGAAAGSALVLTNAGTIATLATPYEPLGPSTRRTELVFSEIMYKPSARSDGLNAEYLEVYNSNPWWDDISGYRLAGEVQYSFPAGTIIPGGGFLVVAAAPSDVAKAYGGLTNVTGPYVGSLKKGGQLQLLDQQGAILLDMTYTNTLPWPAGADGTGHSIVLARPSYGEADPRAWAVSDVAGGSPGGPEAYRPGPLRNVVINEWLARHDGATSGYVELYNHNTAAVDVSGCVLTDDATKNKFVIPAGTMMAAGGFAVFTESEMGFALAPGGGLLLLRNPDGSRVEDAVTYEGQGMNVAFGRWPDGAGDFYALAGNTPGRPNGDIWIGDVVINEIMYKPVSGNDDDQYVELYNKGVNAVALDGWRFTAGIGFEFPAGTSLAAGGYLVVGRNVTNLWAKYPNLNSGNTAGNFTGKLPHKGGRLALAGSEAAVTSGSGGQSTTTTIYPVADEVTYQTGGRWGQWAHGGGSSLELINPNTNHRLAHNWADSDETGKSAWTNLVFTGLLDNGVNYNGGTIDIAQVGLLDVGEALVGNLVFQAGTTGPNLIQNGDFAAGITGWTAQGDHVRSGLDVVAPAGQGPSANALHLRASNRVWTGENAVQGVLAHNTLGSGDTATLSLAGRWLRGSPEVLLRVRGNWIELAGAFPIPSNLGTPGRPNSQYAPKPGPAIFEVNHSPPIPAANQPVTVTARFHAANSLAPTLLYRIDSSTSTNAAPVYIPVPMVDDGSGGDSIAGDGIFSATIPPQPAGAVVAFLVQATDAVTAARTVFPDLLHDNSGLSRECVVVFGDTIPGGTFGHYHLWMTQNWLNRWIKLGGVSNEPNDGTFVDGGGRVIYNMSGYYAGSVGHQSTGSPVTNVIGSMEWKMPEDDRMLGKTSFDKQHVPGNAWVLDNTLQREQTAFWMARQIGLRWDYRRNYVLYINGVRHGALMEDTQVPDSDMIDEYWPEDNNGFLYKNHIWFEFDPVQQTNGYTFFNQDSCCPLAKYTTTTDGENGLMKVPRYRWTYWLRQYPDSASNFTNVWALINAANIPATDPAYFPAMEAVADTEEYMRMSAAEHATGDGDNMFGQSQHNMYTYKPLSGKLTVLKWDWNACLGGGWPSDGSELFAFNLNDPAMVAFQRSPPYFRSLLRAYKELANGPLTASNFTPVLNARFAAYAANGLTGPPYNILSPDAGGLTGWIATMHDSILAALTAQGVDNVAFTVIGPTHAVIVGTSINLAGTAPLEVKTITVNNLAAPVVWTSTTNWTLRLPLHTATNHLTLQGVDLHGGPVPGASAALSVTSSSIVPSPPVPVRINEWMASNRNTVFDPADGKSEDWFELYNPNQTSADISGYYLTHDPATPELFRVPAGTVIPAKAFLLVWADGGLTAAYDAPNFYLHANFKLSKAGAAIALFDSQGAPVDAVAFGPQSADISEGRFPDGATNIFFLTRPTPGDRNQFSNSTSILNLNPRLTAGQLMLTWSCQPNQTYQLQFTDDLASTNWTTLESNFKPAGPTASIGDRFSLSNSARFYRILRLP